MALDPGQPWWAGAYAHEVRRDRATDVVEGLLAAICAREPGSVSDMVVGVDVFGPTRGAPPNREMST